MGNQLAIATQTQPGDEVIVGEGAHPVWFEAGAGAALSGVQFAVAGKGGLYTAEEMEEQIKPSVYWGPRTSLVCIENTHNRAGGRVWPLSQARTVAERAHARGLLAHLDGARIWNASVASGTPVNELAAGFDTVSVCFSKGLGAPIGSAFCASRAVVERARRLRKMWGGATRQAGVLAAAARYALSHHRERLAEDHANAAGLAAALAGAPRIQVDAKRVETNIVNIDLDVPAEAVVRGARDAGLLINATSARRLRAVVHLDVSREDIERAAGVLRAVAAKV
jgi:threonine aldolase